MSSLSQSYDELITYDKPMIRLDNIKQIEGKTIKQIDNFSLNVVNILFTDGTTVCLESENAGVCGLTCITPYLVDMKGVVA